MDLLRAPAWLTAGTGLEAAGAAAAVVLVVSGVALGVSAMRNFGELRVAPFSLDTLVAEAPLSRFCDLPAFSRAIDGRQANGRRMALKMSVVLEFDGAAPCEQVYRMQPQILDRLDGHLGRLRIGDLQGARELYQLRADMLRLINEALAPIRVKDVLLKEMLVQ